VSRTRPTDHDTRSPSAPRVADALREGILRGAHPAGVKLRQEELASKLGCSVIPLREALHMLAAEGLVEFLPNRGARVRPVSSKELREMAEVRSTLTASGMKLASPHMTPAVITRARAIVAAMDRERDPAAQVRLYADFHEAILEPAGRPFLVATLRGIILSGLRYMPVWREAWSAGGEIPTPGFGPVLDALERKDLKGAMRILGATWEAQEHVLAEHLSRREAGGKPSRMPRAPRQPPSPKPRKGP